MPTRPNSSFEAANQPDSVSCVCYAIPEIFGDAAPDDDGIASLVSLTQQVFGEVERELKLAGFWESIPARNKLKADIQKTLLLAEFSKLPGLVQNRAHIISRAVVPNPIPNGYPALWQACAAWRKASNVQASAFGGPPAGYMVCRSMPACCLSKSMREHGPLTLLPLVAGTRQQVHATERGAQSSTPLWRMSRDGLQARTTRARRRGAPARWQFVDRPPARAVGAPVRHELVAALTLMRSPISA